VESFCFCTGNMLNFSVYLPEFGWIGGKFPPNNSYAQPKIPIMLMKEYHTDIILNVSADRVWEALTDFSAYPEWNPLVGWLKGDFNPDGQIQMFITPLNRSFKAKLKTVQKDKEYAWIGVAIAPWFLSGEHYYCLEKINDASTRLLHGEYFRGWGSALIGKSMLRRMENAFIDHNLRLKERVERE
jgi:hypothetical protein